MSYLQWNVLNFNCRIRTLIFNYKCYCMNYPAMPALYAEYRDLIFVSQIADGLDGEGSYYFSCDDVTAVIGAAEWGWTMFTL